MLFPPLATHIHTTNINTYIFAFTLSLDNLIFQFA